MLVHTAKKDFKIYQKCDPEIIFSKNFLLKNNSEHLKFNKNPAKIQLNPSLNTF